MKEFNQYISIYENCQWTEAQNLRSELLRFWLVNNFQKLRYDNENTFIEKIRLTQPVTTNLMYFAAFVTLESRGCNEDGSEAGGK